MLKQAIAVLMVVFIASCAYKGLDPITPQPPVITDSDMCPKACENLDRLGCEEGDPIETNVDCTIDPECPDNHTCKAGSCWATCEQFCRDTQSKGVWLDPTCVSKVKSCDMIESCPVAAQ